MKMKSRRFPAFDRGAVTSQVSRLRPEARAAFAALAAERLLPYYGRFQAETGWGSVGPLKRGLDLVWQYVLGRSVSGDDVRKASVECKLVAPDTEDFETPLVSRALDATSAVLSALRACEDPAPGVSAAAAESAWEAAFGTEQLGGAGDAGPAVRFALPEVLGAEARGELVRREEAAQAGALQRLASIALTSDVVEALRHDYGSAPI